MTEREDRLISLLDEAYNEGLYNGSNPPSEYYFIPISLQAMSELLANETYQTGKIYIVEDEHNS